VEHFIDRLHAGVQQKRSPLCVGLDPRYDLLPKIISSRFPETLTGQANAVEYFCCQILDLVAPFTGVVKPQSAFFELLGAAGHVAIENVIRKAHSLGLLVILDAKRNDIASTAQAYAEAAFRLLNADALTINPYLGRDSIEPFIQEARRLKRGLYVLVRTSNAGAGMFQDLQTERGKVHHAVARAVAAWSRENLGKTQFGDIGAVVGATSPDELAELRQIMPQVPFLVPGYGAQGGTAQDCQAAFSSNGLGAVVNSSRGILYPFKPDEKQWEEKVQQAAQSAANELEKLLACANSGQSNRK
jgi:orotidine-5'-phosphate decarboxylase